MTQLRKLTPFAPAVLAALALSAAGCQFGSGNGSSDPATDEAGEAEAGMEFDAKDGGQVEQLLAQARDAASRGELMSAYQSYAQALDIDPGNPEAKNGFATVGATLGLREEGVDEIADAATEITQVRMAQVRMEAESRVKQGEVALGAEEYDDAIQAFEDALLIVRYNPFLEGGTLTEQGLSARIESARSSKSEHDRREEIARQARIAREQTEREAEERARLENRIITLFEAANLAYQDDRYGEAESYLTEILRIDPANQEAAGLKDLARDARMQALNRSQRSNYKRQWRETFDGLTEMLRPQMDILVYPDEKEWRRISEQGPIEFSVQDELVSAAERDIMDKLATVPMTMSFDTVTLSEAVEWFRTVTGVNFIVSPTIIDSGDEPDFTLNAGPMPARDALDLLVDISSTPITYRITDGVVHVLSQDEALGGQILEIYDVRDLAKVISNFPAKDFNLKPSGFSDDDFLSDEGPEPAPLVLEQDRLADLIMTNIAPESWDLDPNNSVQAVSGALVVRQTREVQDLIRTLLSDLRENSGTLINIESRFLNVSDSFLEDIGVDFRGLEQDEFLTGDQNSKIPNNLILDDFGTVPNGFGTPANPSGIGTDNDVGIYFVNGSTDVKGRTENLYDVTLGNDEFDNSGGLSLQGTFLNDTLVEAVLRAVSKYGTTNIVDAPSLTVFNGQRASLSVIDNVSFVKDFDVEIAQAAVIAQPIVDVIQDGVVLDVRPVVSSDRRFVTMELRPTVAKLMRPIPTFTTNLSIGSDVTIELPELLVQRARTTVTMPDGSTLMIGGWKEIEDQDFESGIPFLNKIPLLSALVSRKGKFLDKRKLIILVRAKIVIPEESAPQFGLGR